MANLLGGNGWKPEYRWTLGFVVLLGLLVLTGALVLAYDLPSWLLWTLVGAGALLAVVALAIRRWRELAAAAVGLGAVLGLLSGIPPVADLLDRPGATGRSEQAQSLAAVCQDRVGAARDLAAFSLTGGTDAERFTFSDVRYALRLEDGQFHLSAAGLAQGPLPRGRQLYLLGSPDRGTIDQFGNAGTGSFFPQQRLRQDCWELRQRPLGYPGACGLTYRYFIASVPDTAADEFDRYKADHDAEPTAPNHGFTSRQLDQRDVEHLGFFRVPTGRHC